MTCHPFARNKFYLFENRPSLICRLQSFVNGGGEDGLLN